MVKEEKLRCEADVWPSYNLKKFTLASFSKKKKTKINFYSRKKIFIRSRYWKLLLNHRYILFVINVNFYIPVLQLLPDSSA